MNLHLEPPQVDLLREVLDSTFRDVRHEVADTDNRTFTAELRNAAHRSRPRRQPCLK